MSESDLKKQILYPGLFVRVMSSFIDMTFASIIFMPLSNWLRLQYFISTFGDLAAQYDIDPKNLEATASLFSRPEIYQSIPISEQLYAGIVNLLCAVVLPLFCYLVTSWTIWGTTPAKYLLSMKIVDEETMKKPKLINLIWRFLGYSLFFIGIWFIFFTKKNQALHDKLGKTIVISA